MLAVRLITISNVPARYSGNPLVFCPNVRSVRAITLVTRRVLMRTQRGVIRLALEELAANATAENIDWTISPRARLAATGLA